MNPILNGVRIVYNSMYILDIDNGMWMNQLVATLKKAGIKTHDMKPKLYVNQMDKINFMSDIKMWLFKIGNSVDNNKMGSKQHRTPPETPYAQVDYIEVASKKQLPW